MRYSSHVCLMVLAVSVAGCGGGGGSDPWPVSTPALDPAHKRAPAPEPDPDPGPEPAPEPEPDRTTVDVFIEDAPPQFDSIEAVCLHIDRAEAVQVDATLGLSTVHPLTVVRSVVDVLPLRGGQRARIATGSVPAGEYFVVLHLSDAHVEVNSTCYSTENGLLTLGGGTDVGSGRRSYDVKTAFGEEVSVAQGETTPILVDFDISRSLEAEGDPEAPTSVVMTPVMRLREVSDGGLRGVVRSDSGTPDDPSDDVPVANAQVLLLQEGGVDLSTAITAETHTDAQGAYVLQGVTGGTAVFQLVIERPGFETHFGPNTLEVTTGQFTTYDAVLTPDVD